MAAGRVRHVDGGRERGVMFFAYVGTSELLILGVVFLLPLVLSLVALVDIARRPFREANAKLLWFLIVLVAPVLGALLYFVVGRKASGSGAASQGYNGRA